MDEAPATAPVFMTLAERIEVLEARKADLQDQLEAQSAGTQEALDNAAM